MRQRDALFFAQLLNRLREGKQTPADVAFLRTLILRDEDGTPITDFDHPRYPRHLPHQCATNAR